MIRHLLTFGVLIAATACGGDPAGPASARGLTLEVAVSSPSIEFGEVDTITATLTNTTSSRIDLTFPSSCQIIPYVTNMLGTIVAPPGGSRPCLTVIGSRTLEPHEVQMTRFLWLGAADFTGSTRGGRLPGGVYRVYATLAAYDVQLISRRVTVLLK
jgi:hypothetical protein